MATKKPPSEPPARDESTVLTPQPVFSDEELRGLDDGIVFDSREEDAPTLNRAPRPTVSDISLIEAQDVHDSLELDDGVLEDPAARNTEVLRIAMSGEESLTPTEPPAVKKFRIADASAAPAPPGAVPATHFALPSTEASTRIDVKPAALTPTVDLAALRTQLEDVDKMLRSVKLHVQTLDLETARGLNAQLSAAVHSLHEALALLGGVPR